MEVVGIHVSVTRGTIVVTGMSKWFKRRMVGISIIGTGKDA